MKLSRTYNSFGSMSSWFGPGWSTDLQNRVFVLPGGDLLFRQNGVENVFIYRRDEDAPAQVERIAREALIVAQAWRQAGHHSAADEHGLALELARDAEKRHKLAEQMQLRGALQAEERLRGQLCESDAIRAVAVPASGGTGSLELQYERELCRGGREHFDAQGRLLWRETQPGYRVTLDYPDDGSDRPVRMHDRLGHVLHLTWTHSGSLAAARLEGGTNDGGQARYEYENGLLVAAESASDQAYRYRYDSRGNLVETTYDDGTRMVIDYDSRDRVVRTSARDASVQTYRYEDDLPSAPSSDEQADPALVQTVAAQIERDPATGKITRVVEPRGDFRYRFDAQDRLVEASRAGDTSVRLSYTSSGDVERLSLISAEGALLDSVLYLYDEQRRNTRLILEGKGRVDARRDASGKLLDLEFDLDEQGRLTLLGIGGRLQMLMLPAEQAERER